jgi:alcohol dehydrogenase, propanol-preferring
MKAWILEKQAAVDKKPLRYADLPDPHPQEREIRIKIQVCGICRTDIHILEGDLPLKKSPLILGHEIVGIVDEVGEGVNRFSLGDRAGVSWLYETCGQCRYCLAGDENYCPHFKAAGWDADGGFAEYITIKEDFALSLKHVPMKPEDIAPLLCPGIAGYCAFKLTGAQKGDKLGLYGFGPTAFYVLKVAQYLEIPVYVSTRSDHHIQQAKQEGAVWSADAGKEKMPASLDSAVVFPPAGKLVEVALSQINVGGTLVLAPVSMSTIEIKNYSHHLWGRDIKTLYNVKKSQGEEFLRIAAQENIQMGRQVFSFQDLPEALIEVKEGKIIHPNAVIKVT